MKISKRFITIVLVVSTISTLALSTASYGVGKPGSNCGDGYGSIDITARRVINVDGLDVTVRVGAFTDLPGDLYARLWRDERGAVKLGDFDLNKDGTPRDITVQMPSAGEWRIVVDVEIRVEGFINQCDGSVWATTVITPTPTPTPIPYVGKLTGFCEDNAVYLNWTSDSRANSNGLQKGDSFPSDPERFWGWLSTTNSQRSYVDHSIVPGVEYQYRVKYRPELPSNIVAVICPIEPPSCEDINIDLNATVTHENDDNITYEFQSNVAGVFGGGVTQTFTKGNYARTVTITFTADYEELGCKDTIRVTIPTKTDNPSCQDIWISLGATNINETDSNITYRLDSNVAGHFDGGRFHTFTKRDYVYHETIRFTANYEGLDCVEDVLVYIPAKPGTEPDLMITKYVRNVDGSPNFYKSIESNPEGLVEFSIWITGGQEGVVHNVRVYDELPLGLEYYPNTFRLNGEYRTNAADLINPNGFYIGNVTPGEKIEVLFRAGVENAGFFPTSTTTLTNWVHVTSNELPKQSDSAKVIIRKFVVCVGCVPTGPLDAVRNTMLIASLLSLVAYTVIRKSKVEDLGSALAFYKGVYTTRWKERNSTLV